MSVNNMSIEDAYQFLNAIHEEATGRTSIAPVNTAEFISMATTTLAVGVDIVYNSVMKVIGKTIFSTRPYKAKFDGISADNVRWGGIIRKITVCDHDLTADKAYHDITDGTSVDMYERRIQNVLETRWYGSSVYQDSYTVYRQQLEDAFRSPAELGSFVALLASEMSNKWEQYKEEFRRMALCNFIASKATNDSASVIHLLTEYNNLSGQSLTAQDIYLPANVKPFFEFVKGRINIIAREMTERSVKYQQAITGKPITRHTPYRDQKHFISAHALELMRTMVLPEAFHNEDLKYVDTEGVTYWQSIETPMEIQVKPALMDSDGVISESVTDVTVSDIFGLMIDRDAVVSNLEDYTVLNTPMNPRGLYFNTWLTAHVKYANDLTEKGVLLLLD